MVVAGEVGQIMERVGLESVDQMQMETYDKNGVARYPDDPDDYPCLWENPAFVEPIKLAKSWQTLLLK